MVKVMESSQDEEREIMGSEVDKNFSGINTREYQMELFEMAKKQNLIICLPTGSGKTWISLLLTKHYLSICITQKDKKVVFLANTVQLVNQQFEYFRNNLPDGHVSHFTGDMNVDTWDSELWKRKLAEAEVLIMSTQIFFNILNKEITLDKVVLMIFDECHHADKNHSMNSIMDDYKRKPSGYELPRILGLTATIIKGLPKKGVPISEEIKRMEQTMVARAITYHEYEQVLRFSTTATPQPRIYEGEYSTETHPVLKELVEDLNGIGRNREDLKLLRNILTAYGATGVEAYLNNKSLSKILRNHVVELDEIYKSLGPYCALIGARILILSALVRVKVVSKQEHILTFEVYISGLTQFMATVRIEMRPADEWLSPKIKSLMWELMVHKHRASQELCGIVFVERKLDCQVLNWACKDLAQKEQKFAFLKPNFITAADNEFGFSPENSRITHHTQREIIRAFREKKYNLLFSTAVLEEGLDVASCNLIIRFDRIKSYRSYTQSMGRARSKDSEFIVLVKNTESKEDFKVLENFKSFSIQLADALAMNALHVGEEVECIPREDEITPFCPGGEPDSPRITSRDAIQLINTYCQTVGDTSQDVFSGSMPLAWPELVVSPFGLVQYRAFLRLPKTTLINYTIEGQLMDSKAGAKRAVYLEACRRLYEAGGLDDYLRPVRPTVDPKVLRFFQTRESVAPVTGLPKNWCRKTIPDAFKGIGSLQDTTYTLYEVTVCLMSPQGLEKEKYFDYSGKKHATGILSAAPLDMIPPFKLVSRMGALKVELKNLSQFMQPITLNPVMLGILKTYQRNLFSDVLKLNLNCVGQTEDSSVWIVPILKEGINYYLDVSMMKELGTVYNGGRLDSIYSKYVPEGERTRPGGGYEDAVVIPWYDVQKLEKFYSVLDVKRDITPLSVMEKSKTYVDHYKVKGINVVWEDQPLLSCYTAVDSLEYLKVRKGSGKAVDQDKDSSGGVINLLPELVRPFVLPASIYSQAIMMPSILHRISRFLITMELGAEISNRHTPLERPTYKSWDQWNSDQETLGNSLSIGLEQLNLESGGSAHALTDPLPCEFSPDLKYFDPRTVTVQQVEEKAKEIKRMEEPKSPLVISMKTPHGKVPYAAVSSSRASSSSSGALTQRLSDRGRQKDDTFSCQEIFDVIRNPPIYEILQAITLAASNDRFSLERLEVIGDSFLKYCTTLFLCGTFPEYDEGRLTELRGKLVSNEHLRRLGNSKGLGGILASGIYDPEHSFLPPSYSVIEKFTAVGMELGVGLGVFDKVPPAKLQTMSHEELVTAAKAGSSSTKRTNYGYSKVNDKDVADCVEALIGAYYLTGGEVGALHVMSWLGINGPDGEGNPMAFGVQKVFASPRKLPCQVSPETLLPTIRQIEDSLQYTFTDPWLLVEALTHPNDVRNDVTPSFQRLEFLGDAVLDFLITKYIFNHSEALTPGKITDLRSALVCNATFGSLSVRYGFHKHLLYFSSAIQTTIETFASLQSSNNHQVRGQLQLNERDCRMATDVEVPKVLGDIFESICGAIFIDSGMNLHLTWEIFYSLLKTEIDLFFKNCPVAPIRFIMEKGYKVSTRMNHAYAECTIDAGKYGIFTGRGTSKRSAKDAAAKLVQRHDANATN